MTSWCVAGMRLLVGVILLSAVACGGPVSERRPLKTIAALDARASTALAERRIYFGHQSVGNNIMQGVAALAASTPALGLRVIGPGQEWPGAGGFFAHGLVGKNGDPRSKTDDFGRQMTDRLASRVDIAFHKYCYIDVLERSDAVAIFENYRAQMSRLRSEYPAVTFVHVTVPVTVVQSGPKAVIKRLIGRAPGGYSDNIRRQQFNTLMREAYAGREPLFDLASIEATSPAGDVQSFEFNGQTGLALVPSYASDGRHLGQAGRVRVAEELLVMLASLPRGGTR